MLQIALQLVQWPAPQPLPPGLLEPSPRGQLGDGSI